MDHCLSLSFWPLYCLAIVLSVRLLLAIVLSVRLLLAIVLFVPFLLAIVLSVRLRSTASKYPFGIFKRFFLCVELLGIVMSQLIINIFIIFVAFIPFGIYDFTAGAINRTGKADSEDIHVNST